MTSIDFDASSCICWPLWRIASAACFCFTDISSIALSPVAVARNLSIHDMKSATAALPFAIAAAPKLKARASVPIVICIAAPASLPTLDKPSNTVLARLPNVVNELFTAVKSNVEEKSVTNFVAILRPLTSVSPMPTSASDTPCANVLIEPVAVAPANKSSKPCTFCLAKSNAPDSPILFSRKLHWSERFDVRPVQVCIAPCNEPEAILPIVSMSFSITSRPSKPFCDRFCSSETFLPVALASKSQTGTPASFNCMMSWPSSFIFVHACVSASVMRCRVSFLPPSLATCSPIASNAPFIGSMPALRIWMKVSVTCCTVNGMSAAFCLIHSSASPPRRDEPSTASS